MKIGILISGKSKYTEYFNWNITHVFNQIKEHEFEIYSLTWDTPADSLSDYTLIDSKSQSDLLRPIYDKVRDWNGDNELVKKLFSKHWLGKDDFDSFCNQVGQLAGTYEVYQLTKDSDIDYFIRVRTDLIFDPESFQSGLGALLKMLRDIKFSKEAGIIVPLSKIFKGHGIIGDWWWAFDRNSAEKLFDGFYDKLIKLFTSDIEYMYHILAKPKWMITHSVMSCWLHYNKCHTIDFNYVNKRPIDCILLRRNCQEIELDEINDLSYTDWVDMYYEIQEQFCVSPVD